VRGERLNCDAIAEHAVRLPKEDPIWPCDQRSKDELFAAVAIWLDHYGNSGASSDLLTNA